MPMRVSAFSAVDLAGVLLARRFPQRARRDAFAAADDLAVGDGVEQVRGKRIGVLERLAEARLPRERAIEPRASRPPRPAGRGLRARPAPCAGPAARRRRRRRCARRRRRDRRRARSSAPPASARAAIGDRSDRRRSGSRRDRRAASRCAGRRMRRPRRRRRDAPRPTASRQTSASTCAARPPPGSPGRRIAPSVRRRRLRAVYQRPFARGAGLRQQAGQLRSFATNGVTSSTATTSAPAFAY